MASSTLPASMKIVHQLNPHSTVLTMEESPLPALSHPEDCLIKIYTTSPCLVGDRVFFRVEPDQTGHLRQYSLARLSEMAHIPPNMGWIEAGATALSSLTAWQTLFQYGILDSRALSGDQAARKKNMTLGVLITGASGAVGSWAVYLAAQADAGRIVGLCDGANSAYVRELGATEIVDYKKEGLQEWVAKDQTKREVDYALDCVGGKSLGACWSVVKGGGILLSIAGDPSSEKPSSTTKSLKIAKWIFVEPNGNNLQLIADLIAKQGKWATKIDSVFDFADLQQAFDKVGARKENGKVVIKVAEP